MANPKSPKRSRKTAKAPKPKTSQTFDADRLKEDVDNYVDAIYAVITFINHARWDDATRTLQHHIKYGVGRRFITSTTHPTIPDTEVTPDGSVQMTPTLGAVAEAKPGTSKSKEIWNRNLDQLKKYDDDLTGWWTPNKKTQKHDIVALIPASRVVMFADLVKERLASGEVTFARPFVIVGFYKSSGAKLWVNLKTELGACTDPVFAEKLRLAQPVSWELLLLHYNDVKFIDTEPPLAYTLQILWDIIFSAMVEEKRDPAADPKSMVTIDVNVEQLTRRVQEFYGFRSDGPHSIEVPRQSWIRRALDALVMFGMAERKPADKSYRVHYRRHRTMDRDTLTHFGRLEFKFQERLTMASSHKPLLELAVEETAST